VGKQDNGRAGGALPLLQEAQGRFESIAAFKGRSRSRSSISDTPAS